MKKKEVAELFKTIADSFTKLSEIYSSAEDVEQPKSTVKKEKPAKAEIVSEPSPTAGTTTEEKSEPATYTKEDVRAKLAQKAKAAGGKHKADVKGIVAKFSSDGTLTGVPADRYSELVAELEVVGNA